MNGGLEGFFSGTRGVRQGDPISPYTFVLVMNFLSFLLDIAVKSGVFKYHPKCKCVQLTHICFADDLLIFTKGDLDSVLGVKSVMKYFYEISGLKLNPAKSKVFIAGMSSFLKEVVMNVTGFKEIGRQRL